MAIILNQHIKDIYPEADFLYRTHLSTDRELVVDGFSRGFYSSETRTGLTGRTAAAAKDAPLIWLSPGRHLEIMPVTLSPSLRSRVNSAKGLARWTQRSFPFATLRASAPALRMTA